MGKFGIGARVRDDGGDEGVIVEKAKGVRLVSYDEPLYGKLWQSKAALTALPCSETSENAYLTGGDTENKWMPKVGDRVRVVRHCNWRGDPLRLSAAIGSEHEVTEMRHYFDDEGVATFTLSDGGGNFYTALNVEPVVAPAPITIESGKFYRTRDGRKVGPMEALKHGWTDFHGDKAEFRGLIDGHKDDYTANGLWLTRYGEDRPEDLVAEWDEPAVVAVAEATATERKFKVGDVVNYVMGGKAAACWQGVVITEDDGRLYHATCPKNGQGAFYEDWLEPATPPAKFKVGDRVVILSGPYMSDEALPGQKGRIVFGATLGLRGGWQVELKGGLTLGFNDAELELAPTFPIHSTVTFTATGRLSAINDNGHMQVTFPGLPAGRNSFALPADYVSLA